MLSRNVRLSVLIAIAGLGLAAPPGAQAATRYTTPSPAVGADCSVVAPCDLPTGISGAASGDEVLIGVGTYTVTSDITVSDKTLSLRGAAIGAGRPVINVSAALVLRTGATLRDVEMRFSSRYLRLEGGTVDRVVVVSTTNNSEDNCRIQGAATSKITNSLCLKTIPAFGSTIGLGDSATLQLEGSTVVGDGVALYNSGQTAVATNSILESSSGNDDDVNAGGPTTLAFDAFVTTSASPSVFGKVGTRATFVSRAAGDYRQTVGSPTIDAGTTSTSTLDLNGNLRTLGAASDIGAYEFVPAPPGIAASVPAPAKHTATPAAAIDTKGGRTTARLDYGPTAAYGTSLPSQLIPAATSVATVTEALTGLAEGTTYHYRWTATSDGGTTSDADRTFTTAPSEPTTLAPPPAAAVPPPVPPAPTKITGAKLSKSSFVAGKSTTFVLTTSGAGIVKIAISKPTTGRRQSGTCKPLTKKNAKEKKCTFDQAVTTLTQTHTAGRVSMLFNGKVGKKKLAAGKYKATITVTSPTGSVSAPFVLTFRIKRK
jgi:hypothetical protein